MSSSDVRIFASFDVDHDADLYALLLEESRAEGAGFTVCGSSQSSSATELGSERGRAAIREADQMIVLCSEHTDTSTRVSAELRIAAEEGTPCVLLWGRRGVMCKKPVGAKPSEGMYSWTRQILKEQIALTSRKAAADASAAASDSTTTGR